MAPSGVGGAVLLCPELCQWGQEASRVPVQGGRSAGGRGDGFGEATPAHVPLARKRGQDQAHRLVPSPLCHTLMTTPACWRPTGFIAAPKPRGFDDAPQAASVAPVQWEARRRWSSLCLECPAGQHTRAHTVCRQHTPTCGRAHTRRLSHWPYSLERVAAQILGSSGCPQGLHHGLSGCQLFAPGFCEECRMERPAGKREARKGGTATGTRAATRADALRKRSDV